MPAIKDYVRVFRALTDENRVRILELLSSGEQCACVLLHDLQISQPTLSHHMKILCDSGLIRSRRVGKWNYYSINADGCEYAGRLLNAIVNRDADNVLRVMLSISRFLGYGRAFGQLIANEKDDARSCCCAHNY